ncbi:MAG: sulfur oxidation c-type cytochrome SoxA [Gammaproteobacteria bacterium]|nr:sulfur oxidation c-type cytochrome SoxA [Gammaproteobacteria bacterium]
MRKLILVATAILVVTAIPSITSASPEKDLQAFRDYYQQRFPNTPSHDFANGVYAIDAASREQWQAIEEFPPYELHIDKGERLFNKPFKNGKTYASCFQNPKNARAQYPKFNQKSGKVETLEGAINACRVANGEKKLRWKTGRIADISAYMASTARGNKLHVTIPNDPRARAIYERGKKSFYAKRGQLNLACADCHVQNAGRRVRAEILSPAIGHTTGFPVYRSMWGGLGTLHRRFSGCYSQVRAKPPKPQSDAFVALEYFLAYMGNGLEVNGPSARK